MSNNNTLTVDEFVDLFPNQKISITLTNEEVFKLFSDVEKQNYSKINTIINYTVVLIDYLTIAKICGDNFAQYMKILDNPNIEIKIIPRVASYFHDVNQKYLQNYIELYMCVFEKTGNSVGFIFDYFIEKNDLIYTAELFNNMRFINYFNKNDDVSNKSDKHYGLAFKCLQSKNISLNEIYNNYFNGNSPIKQLPRDIADKYIREEQLRISEDKKRQLDLDFDELHREYATMMANKSRDCTNDAKKITELFGILMREEQK